MKNKNNLNIMYTGDLSIVREDQYPFISEPSNIRGDIYYNGFCLIDNRGPIISLDSNELDQDSIVVEAERGITFQTNKETLQEICIHKKHQMFVDRFYCTICGYNLTPEPPRKINENNYVRALHYIKFLFRDYDNGPSLEELITPEFTKKVRDRDFEFIEDLLWHLCVDFNIHFSEERRVFIDIQEEIKKISSDLNNDSSILVSIKGLTPMAAEDAVEFFSGYKKYTVELLILSGEKDDFEYSVRVVNKELRSQIINMMMGKSSN